MRGIEHMAVTFMMQDGAEGGVCAGLLDGPPGACGPDQRRYAPWEPQAQECKALLELFQLSPDALVRRIRKQCVQCCLGRNGERGTQNSR